MVTQPSQPNPTVSQNTYSLMSVTVEMRTKQPKETAPSILKKQAIPWHALPLSVSRHLPYSFTLSLAVSFPTSSPSSLS